MKTPVSMARIYPFCIDTNGTACINDVLGPHLGFLDEPRPKALESCPVSIMTCLKHVENMLTRSLCRSESFFFLGSGGNKLRNSDETTHSWFIRASIESMGPPLTIEDFSCLLVRLDDPSLFLWVIDYCQDFFLEDTDYFHETIWFTLAGRFVFAYLRMTAFEIESWSCVLKKVINTAYTRWTTKIPSFRGWADKGQPSSDQSVLQFIMDWARSPVDSQILVQAWFQFLSESGINVERYLATEYTASDTGDEDLPELLPSICVSYYEREVMVNRAGDLHFCSWNFRISESCQIRELVSEYPYIASQGPAWRLAQLGYFTVFLIPVWLSVREEHSFWA